jgi:hypothetical protein
MCPLSAPRLEFHVARMEMFNASWHRRDPDDLLPGLSPRLRFAIRCDLGTSQQFDQGPKLVRSRPRESEVRDACLKKSDRFASHEGRHQRIVIRPASLREDGREPGHAF